MRVLIYIATALAIVVLSDFIYKWSGGYASDIRKCNAELLLNLDSAATRSDVLYLGESSDFTSAAEDTDRRSISNLVAACAGVQKLQALSKGAVHAGTYRALIQRLDDSSSVKTIIVTVNLRSFGINWLESKLETQLARAEVMYSTHPPILKKLMLSFRVYDHAEPFERLERIRNHYRHDRFRLVSKTFETVQAWDAFVFDKGIPNENGEKDPALTNLACHFIKNYAFEIKPDNRRIKDLDEIVAFCRARQIALVFHLLPENLERARQLCGMDLEVLMRGNALYLENRYKSKTFFVNNLSLLPDSCFIDKEWPTEHYDFNGRQAIAKNICKVLTSIPPKF